MGAEITDIKERILVGKTAKEYPENLTGVVKFVREYDYGAWTLQRFEDAKVIIEDIPEVSVYESQHAKVKNYISEYVADALIGIKKRFELDGELFDAMIEDILKKGANNATSSNDSDSL